MIDEKIVIDKLNNIKANFKEYFEKFKEYNIDFSNIKTINWAISGTEFVSTALNIYREYLDVNIDFTDFKVALNAEKLPDFVSYTFDEIEKSISEVCRFYF